MPLTNYPWRKWLHPRSLLYVLLWGWIAFQVYKRAPTWWDSYQLENKKAPITTAFDFDGTEVTLPFSGGQPTLLVFWATWCGPCKIELGRLQSAIEDGDIPAHRIFAISLQESPQVVKNFLKDNPYTFNVLLDPTGRSVKTWPISGTPTVAHIDPNGVIKWISTGLSPTGIYRAKRLFEK